MAANCSSEALLHKNAVSTEQEHLSICRPSAHQRGPSEVMNSSPAPNTGRSQESGSGPGLLQCSTVNPKQEVDGQRQSVNRCPPQHTGPTTVAANLNSSICTSDPAPPHIPQRTEDSSHALLCHKGSPPSAAMSQNSSPITSEKSLSHQNGHQQNEQHQSVKEQQQPQGAQSTPPECHPQNSPQQVNHTLPHNSVQPHHAPKTSPSPQHPTVNSPGQSGPPQPATLNSLSSHHPFAPFPSHPSSADHGDQRPSESTNRPDTESTAAPPQNTMMKSGPQDGIFKDQGFSPNHHQTTLVGRNQGMQSQRGPAPAHNTAVPLNCEVQANGAMPSYGQGNHQHLHLDQANRNRPIPPSAHNTYQNQTMKPLHNAAHHPTYHQQGGTAYSYHMAGQQHPQSHPNMYPLHQYQQQHYYPQLHPQAPAHNQANNRGSYPPEEWHRFHYQTHQPVQPNAYLPVASARGSGQLKDNSVSPLASEDSSGATLLSPGSVPEAGPNPGGLKDEESREQVSACSSSSACSPAKHAHKENSEEPESPKEILDLDSHNAASHYHGSQPPPQRRSHMSPGHVMSGFMYDPHTRRPGMQQSEIPPSHSMPQAHGSANRASYSGRSYLEQGCYAAQRPHPHLMEALQRPQQLPYSPGQTRMAMYRHPQPGGHLQGMMLQQRSLGPENFLHQG